MQKVMTYKTDIEKILRAALDNPDLTTEFVIENKLKKWNDSSG